MNQQITTIFGELAQTGTISSYLFYNSNILVNDCGEK
jgi:hypothetical protein